MRLACRTCLGFKFVGLVPCTEFVVNSQPTKFSNTTCDVCHGTGGRGPCRDCIEVRRRAAELEPIAEEKDTWVGGESSGVGEAFQGV
jgi:hypothetical protein